MKRRQAHHTSTSNDFHAALFVDEYPRPSIDVCTIGNSPTLHTNLSEPPLSVQLWVSKLSKSCQHFLNLLVKKKQLWEVNVLSPRMPLYGTLSLFRTSFAGCYAFPCVSLGCDVSTCKPYALDCKKGGLVKQGHNDVRDSDVSLCCMGRCRREPVLVPENDRTTHPALQCRLIGLYEVCGMRKVTGWRSLTIGSLMPTHPVTGPQTCHGKPLPDEQRVRKSESTLWSPRSSGDRSRPWCAVKQIALSTLSTQPSSVSLQAVLLWSGTDPIREWCLGSASNRSLRSFALSICDYEEDAVAFLAFQWPTGLAPWCEQCLTDSAKWTIFSYCWAASFSCSMHAHLFFLIHFFWHMHAHIHRCTCIRHTSLRTHDPMLLSIHGFFLLFLCRVHIVQYTVINIHTKYSRFYNNACVCVCVCIWDGK